MGIGGRVPSRFEDRGSGAGLGAAAGTCGAAAGAAGADDFGGNGGGCLVTTAGAGDGFGATMNFDAIIHPAAPTATMTRMTSSTRRLLPDVEDVEWSAAGTLSARAVRSEGLAFAGARPRRSAS